MNEETPVDPLMSHPITRLRRLYEPLSLLMTLGEVRGNRIKPFNIPQDNSGFNAIKSHRSFVDALAYACAYKKEPAYVTAVALEKRPEEIVVLLAANKGVEDSVVRFVHDILKIVQWLARKPSAQLSSEDGLAALQFLTSKVLRFNAPKIYAYYRAIVDKAAPAVMGKLSNGRYEDNREIANFKQWLSQNLHRDGLQLQEADMENLAARCHNSRRTFEVLRHLAMESHEPQAFERLFKLLNKLGKHVVMSKRIVEGTMALRSDFARGMTVERIPGSPEVPLPFSRRKYNIDGISNRMFPDPAETQRFVARLRTIYDTNELDKLLTEDHLAGKTIVHAEILLLDHFEKTGGDFLNNADKYIGCSKPACYLCYQYICNHPGRYTLPPSHQKLYMKWRLPDIRESEPNAATRFRNQEQILRNMTEFVRRELKKDIENGVGKLKGHPDSTAGGTSTTFEIQTGLEADMGSLSFQELRQQIDPDFEFVVVPEPVSSASSASSIYSRSSADTAVSV
ncbi:hypothetical protein CNMCM7691_004252 [Aspergillus felis]|uniref:Uncharacterized protein n=1 Tax=Aspergillus felis TaxID=1287682 RepID=A0A8H6VEB9_9EURO|nr:hypothetical protein CNMCM7691_004252 [Aspergillus felis]